MDNELISKLYEDFKVDVKPGKGNFKYIKTRYIIDRFNKVFSGNWSTTVVKTERVGDEILVCVRVNILDDDGKVKAWHEGFGSAKHFNNLELGNVYKSAKSRAIKDAVRNWGVGLFIDEAYDDGHSITSNIPTTSVGVPPTSSNPVQNVSAPQNNTPATNIPTNGGPSGVSPTVPQFSEPQTNVQPNPAATSDAPVSVPPPFGDIPTEVNSKSTTSPNNGLPNMNIPQSPTTTSEEVNNAPLTDVQKVAIKAKLDATNTTLEELMTKAFAAAGKECPPIPSSVDELRYVDALVLASYR